MKEHHRYHTHNAHEPDPPGDKEQDREEYLYPQESIIREAKNLSRKLAGKVSKSGGEHLQFECILKAIAILPCFLAPFDQSGKDVHTGHLEHVCEPEYRAIVHRRGVLTALTPRSIDRPTSRQREKNCKKEDDAEKHISPLQNKRIAALNRN
jgi:hypothetical protein